MFAAEQFHLLLEGFAHRNAHSQAKPRSPFQVRRPATHLRITARLVRTVARPPVLGWSHAAALTAASAVGSSRWATAICLTCGRSIVVAEEADEVVLGMLVLEGGAQIARDSALQAAIAGKLIQMGRAGIDRPVVEAELAHRIRRIGEDAAKAAARGILIRPLIPTGIGAACAAATGAGRVARVGGVAVRGGEAWSAVRNGQRLLIGCGHVQWRGQTHMPAHANAERHGEGVHGQAVHGAVLAANGAARRQAVHGDRGIG